jgi:phage tail-like protein
MKSLALCTGVLLSATAIFLSVGGPLLRSAPAQAGEPTAVRVEEAGGGFSLRVTIENLPPFVLRGLEGLEVSTEVVEFKDATNPNRIAKLPGRTTYGNVRMKFDPVPGGDGLWKWYTEILAGKVERRKMSITLFREGKDLRRYDFTETWPCRWEGPRLASTSQSAEFEQVTITYETVTRVAS